MVKLFANRRRVLTGFGALALAPHAAFAEDVIDLEWQDLLPDSGSAISPALQSLFEHDETAIPSGVQPQSTGVRTDWNGAVVSLPGFIVPIDYAGSGVTAFILVPYVGACVHVPPPPANQLVFVTTATPYESAGLFEPVTVTGMFGTASTSTQLADIAYALSADVIAPYQG
ncbi:DUF3299 domain-containing protein [Loktanella sp. D2R18]|uniref:DUF3299 domain-containing protein n=1 Tax=Rhodobacterales TaxID=204455 RepID=UPI000DEB68F3|nr:MULTISPECIES: DUF3299 domain-containing protein [Rhodobacterales]MDO6590005.1 DUF3299 domain-containing protein [Yoonia sp. 1_MG-2023]RBW45857.1 DUF3299 domain-containing protein [Loktanella sp. D2R18]